MKNFGYKIFIFYFSVVLVVALWSMTVVQPLSVGSNTTGSRQPLITFPVGATDNTMLGFAAFEKGFTLVSNITTCTYNDFFPVSGPITMNGGSLSLLEDLVISNSSLFIGGGRFYGNNYSIEFPKQPEVFTIPTPTPIFSLSLTTSARSSINGGTRYGFVWSKDDTYLTAGADVSAGKELRIYYFNGLTLTTTQAIDTGYLDGAAWNPRSNYLGIAYNDGGSNSSLQIYRLTVSNGSFVSTALVTPPLANTGVAEMDWHQSGNFLAYTTDNAPNPTNFLVYPFSQVTGLLGTPITLGSVATAFRRVSWAPGGNYLVWSSLNNPGSGNPEVFITSFNGTSLTVTTSAEIGEDVHGADWSPTGTYIAIGTETSLRIYQHQLSPQSLLEVQSARISGLPGIGAVAWDRTGSYLVAGTQGGLSSSFNIYYFDKTAQTLTLQSTFPSSSDIGEVNWSHSNRYLCFENNNTDVVVTTTISLSKAFLFKDTDLVLNGDVHLIGSLKFQGNCKISGRGNSISLRGAGEMIAQPGSKVVFEDVELQGVGSSRIRCLTDQASLTFRNSIINLSSDYTYSRGSLSFDQEVVLTGSNKFIYSTALTSTINADSMLFIDRTTTFSYAPRVAKTGLIFMTDPTSYMYLNGCTLYSTRTGLSLTGGAIIFDDLVTMSSGARFDAEALRLRSDLNIIINGGAQLNLFGRIKYE